MTDDDGASSAPVGLLFGAAADRFSFAFKPEALAPEITLSAPPPSECLLPETSDGSTVPLADVAISPPEVSATAGVLHDPDLTTIMPQTVILLVRVLPSQMMISAWLC